MRGRYRSPREIISELIATGESKIPCNRARNRFWKLFHTKEPNPGKGILAEVQFGTATDYKVLPGCWIIGPGSRVLLYLPQPEDAGYFNASGLSTTLGAPGQHFFNASAVFISHMIQKDTELALIYLQGGYIQRTGVPRRLATKYMGGQVRIVRELFRQATGESLERVSISSHVSMRLKHIFCEVCHEEGWALTYRFEPKFNGSQIYRTSLVALNPAKMR